MKNQNDHSVKNFWNGVLAGCVVSVGLCYIFGTKSGRKNVQTLLTFSENLEKNIHQLVSHIDKSGSKKGQQGSFVEGTMNLLDKIKNISNSA